MPIYLGLDCGGTSCRAMALNDQGEPVFLAQGGSANLVATPEATLERSLRRALEGLPKVDYACACFAGLVSPTQEMRAKALINRHIPGIPIRIEPDYAAALRAIPENCKICVIAGTGSVVCSRDPNHDLVKSGGGGYLLGDEGSGFRYGSAAISHFVRHPHAASQTMKDTMLRLFDSHDPADIVPNVYAAGSPAALLAAAAGALFKDVENRRPYAVAILRRESAALAAVVADHCATYHPDLVDPNIGLIGSVWKKKVVRDAFGVALAAHFEASRLAKAENPPVRGAALLAMEMAPNCLSESDLP